MMQDNLLSVFCDDLSLIAVAQWRAGGFCLKSAAPKLIAASAAQKTNVTGAPSSVKQNSFFQIFCVRGRPIKRLRRSVKKVAPRNVCLDFAAIRSNTRSQNNCRISFGERREFCMDIMRTLALANDCEAVC
jgi:hypothetical protein